MATMNISLPDTMRDWVQSQCDTGLYANNSDYIRDLIRKDQLTKAGDLQLVLKKQKTEAAILKGLNSGEAQPHSITPASSTSDTVASLAQLAQLCAPNSSKAKALDKEIEQLFYAGDTNI